MTGHRIGYGRVSTTDQHAEAQQDALTAAGCAQLFIDKGQSGKLASRPELDKTLAYLRAGDSLVITKLDRLGRSLKNLIELSEELERRGVGLVVLDQGIDTSTPGGKLYFHLVGAFAQFERDMIAERTRDGLAAARARGRKGGRPPKLTPRQVAVIRDMYVSQKHTIKEIAETFGVSHMTIYRHLDPAKAEGSRVRA